MYGEYHNERRYTRPFQSTALSGSPPLSENHRHELEAGSGVAPRLITRRGYKSISAKEALRLGFSRGQARAGLLIPFYSPTGEISYQLKPHDPQTRPGDKKPTKYETRCGYDNVLDVHPSNYQRLVYTNEPILVTEGIKKADCGATRGRLAIGLSGVWNWGKRRERGGAKYGRPELLEDWNAIPLEGRTVRICFDADYREKQGVALGMLRLSERLTERGAHVYIMNLPGPQKGLDDYVVAGGNLDALEREARPFTPSDLIRYAIKADKRIQDGVRRIARAMNKDEWGGWDATTHSLLRSFLELALLCGRYKKDEQEIEVVIGTRELRQYAGIGSKSTLTKHTAKLEERAYITKVVGDRKRGKANRYILKLSNLVPLIGEGEDYSIPGTPLDIFTPHLRWPGPAQASIKGDERDSKLPKAGDKPENPLEHRPILASIYGGVDGEDPPPPQLHTETGVSMGKTVEMAIHVLLSWGGEGTIAELSTALGVNHTTKLRKKLQVAGEVFDLDPKGKHGARVRLKDEWQRHLDGCRENAGEFRRFRHQAIKNRDSRENFRKPDDEPVACDLETALMGPAKVEKIVARGRKREERAITEEQKIKVGMTPEAFISEALEGASGFSWRALIERWTAIGGDKDLLTWAVSRDGAMFTRKREPDGSVSVYRREALRKVV